jgi:hypothetical protein
MQYIQSKKKVGEMGKPDNSNAMVKEFQDNYKKNGSPIKQETRKEAEDAEKGKGKMKIEKKSTINDPRKPRLMTAIDRANIKLKNMY